METPIKREIVDGLVAELGINDFSKATIREVKQGRLLAWSSSRWRWVFLDCLLRK